MNETHIHYKSMFSMPFSNEKELHEQWHSLVKKVGSWVYEKFSSQFDCKSVIKPWLFKGGTWIHKGPVQVKAETRVLSDKEDNDTIPKYWSLRLQHPDNDYPARIWRTDISLTVDESWTINVAVVVSYYTLPGFFGSIPDYSIPNAPRIISYFFECCDGKINVGSQRLFRYPQKVSIGEGRNLVKTILDSKRLCPIILVRPDKDNHLNIDIHRLSQILLGNAVIYYLVDNAVYDEIEFYIARYKQYNCLINSVRIYQPFLRAANPKDSQRHRYFQLDQFVDTSEVIKILAQGVFRTRILPFTDFITSIEDIERKLREFLLSKLKNDPEKSHLEEYYQLLDQENDSIKKEISLLKTTVEEYENRNIEIQIQLEDNQREYSFKEKQLNSSLTHLQIESAKKFDFAELFEKLEEFPTSVSDVVDIIQSIFKEKVLFLKEAVDSAKVAEYNDLKTVWGLLWAMSTVLWELYFPPDESTKPNIDDVFKCKTGYELALTEQKQTKKDSALVELRRRTYKGQTIDITPHAKLEKMKKYFRVHYYVDNGDKRIVIGQCGNHIDTYGKKVKG